MMTRSAQAGPVPTGLLRRELVRAVPRVGWGVDEVLAAALHVHRRGPVLRPALHDPLERVQRLAEAALAVQGQRRGEVLQQRRRVRIHAVRARGEQLVDGDRRAGERAIDILHMEAREGLLDTDLVETMVDSGVYRRILEVDWRAL
jgi:hypothetical protein